MKSLPEFSDETVRKLLLDDNVLVCTVLLNSGQINLVQSIFPIFPSHFAKIATKLLKIFRDQKLAKTLNDTCKVCGPVPTGAQKVPAKRSSAKS
jgi:hypothetical protein